MLPNKVIKVGVEYTCFGLALVLLIDGQRALAFPQQIDAMDRDSIDNYHPTVCWPEGQPLTNIRDFPPCTMLPGWDILGCAAGRIGEDPWDEFGIKDSDQNNRQGERANEPHHFKPAYVYAVRAIDKMNKPHWVYRFMTKLRRLKLLARLRQSPFSS